MPWEFYLTIALLPGFWAGLCVVIAQVSGWTRLASRFAADREPDEGIVFRGQILRIGWSDYSGCLTIRVAPEGLYLAVWPIFVGHRPLLIPWTELRILEERRRRWFAVALVEVSDPPLAKLQLPLRIVDAARSWLRPPQAGDEPHAALQ